ncbi:hypothetical protein A5790_19600 [Mycobacterium sp. 852002-51152_SCH6134967]|uniref:hypothetical protein n=1 Tax=Mycobacterium sp. 852002-51152_SCH6134967 TaxID=1834096 RepID=UPI0007FEAC7C|nr:hypothetical protein [Mycobacterium sp. 852002-51152_SCH6134967]OBF89225.1 hypothetical protein A5790_19600 [Mycobacterium sp. 852002-51152_SCH6134967]
MSGLGVRIARVVVGTAAMTGLFLAPTVLADDPTPRAQSAPCYPGIIPGNPWATSCNFGSRPPRVRGGPPDQTAVIACRDIPGCLSAFVNNP